MLAVYVTVVPPPLMVFFPLFTMVGGPSLCPFSCIRNTSVLATRGPRDGNTCARINNWPAIQASQAQQRSNCKITSPVSYYFHKIITFLPLAKNQEVNTCVAMKALSEWTQLYTFNVCLVLKVSLFL